MKKITLQRKMAKEYAGILLKKLNSLSESELPPYDSICPKSWPDTNTSIRHLVYMCETIQASENDWSVTKLHRWIGYIQGVMTARGFTTVEIERSDYKKVKERITSK
jgi:hypothetical protein